MEQIIYLLVGAALTWAFYFVQRKVERRNTVDAIERNQKLLALKQGLAEADTDLDELRRFEGRLIGRAETAARIADDYFSKAEEVARHTEAEDISQAEMDRLAMVSFHRVDARLQTLVVHLRGQLDGEALDTFEQAHASWLDFRGRHADFIAQSYSGGAIRPLIHAVTLESITLSWISELETQLGDEEDDAAGADDPHEQA